MANQTCGKCYKNTPYQYEKPKFCSHCSASFLEAFAPPKRQSVAADLRRMPRQEEDDDEYEPNSEVIERNERAKDRWKSKPLHAEVEGVQKPRGMKLFDVAMQGDDLRLQENRSEAEVLAELKQENGSIRATPIEINTEDRPRKSI